MMEGGMQLLNRDGHTISHNSKRHYHDSFVSMNRMRQRSLLCDIVLHVSNKEIKAHKVVLASCSPYFHAMFTNEMSESRQTHVTLHDIDPQALEQLVQYSYTAEIVVGEGNVQTLLPAASLLQLNGVRDACCKFLLSQLDPSNCLGIRGFADTHSCSDLLKSAHKYVLQHFVEVSKTEEFMLLPLKQYTSSRPPSMETYRLGSRSSSMSSHSRPERDLRPLSLRYSSPQHPLQPPAEGQVYSTPYAARPRASPPRPDRAPLIKSNSWSTPQSSLSYALSSTQRHSDLCPPRQPLSPLYDEPCTPELYQSSWQGSLGLQQTPAPPPPTFKLCTPPLGRRCRRSLPAPAPPRLRLNAPPVHDQRLIPSSPISSLSKLPYCYSPDLNSYLRPTEPDDQEMDYDNIWEYDQNTGMIQPTSGIPQQRTGLGLEARGLSAMATQQR
ncbi:zinc finger and BTB domain-containing protein 49-like [Gadus chalcogrammus]|uniref:zinc finger and BTB domain-containing protein 49-like n=1 Tax=Gadus chalcogrammus TaxID=1042646 RepID=UPI0024C46682|nr:zinc finger and BTB domain-containing protein 49-like [Gadus chalcogrammus]